MDNYYVLLGISITISRVTINRSLSGLELEIVCNIEKLMRVKALEFIALIPKRLKSSIFSMIDINRIFLTTAILNKTTDVTYLYILKHNLCAKL